MTAVAVENTEQARAWDGDEGEHWTNHESRYDAALRAYRPLFNAATRVGAADAVLDVGCGTGESSRDAARAAPAGRVLGVDLSARMIRRAAERAAAEGLANVEFRQADAQVHPFRPAAFDAVISRTGAMFFGDRAAAFANLARALRPGGRLTLLAWREAAANAWATAMLGTIGAGRDVPLPPPAAPGPFALADPAAVEPVLADAGFTQIRFEALDEPFLMGADAADATRFAAGTGIAQWLLSLHDDAGRAAALDRLHAVLAAHETAAGVVLPSAAWLITARRGGQGAGG